MNCIHGLDLKDECLECEDRLNHLKECKECRDLYPDYIDKQFKPGVD